jgi:protein TonB
MLVFLGAAGQLAYAQQTAPRVYTYVEQMPQLPRGGGMGAVVMELQRRVRWPEADLRKQYNSRATVYLEVSPTGTVQNVKLLRTTGLVSLDSAFTTAAKALPRFTPGYQNGQPVTVSLVVPFGCIKLQ